MQPYEIAMQYVGVQFRHRGRSAHALDCVGLLYMVRVALGLPVHDQKIYGREPWLNGLRAKLVENFGPPIARALQVNDIVLMQRPTDPEPGHVGILAPYPGAGDFLGLVHASGEHGKVVYHRLDQHRKAQITEAFEWPAKD